MVGKREEPQPKPKSSIKKLRRKKEPLQAATAPILEQFRNAKEQHPGMLLLFCVGDIYELFEEDAETAANVLGLTLTSRDKTAMAGFPHHALEAHLQKLLKAGQRVAICEQMPEGQGAR